MTRSRLAATTLLVLFPLVTLTACAGSVVTGHPFTSATATSSTSPATSSAASSSTSSATTSTESSPIGDQSGLPAPREVQAEYKGTVTMKVGERVRITVQSDVYASIDLTDLDQVTLYGDSMTILALKPGTQPFSVPNYDKHPDCPNGPCAHLNTPIEMTLVVTAAKAGSTPAPRIPAPITLTPADNGKTINAKVGQRVLAPDAEDNMNNDSDSNGDPVNISIHRQRDGHYFAVGIAPGENKITTSKMGINDPAPVSVTLKVSY